MQVDIEDTTYLSKYFVITEFNPLFTSGKNPVSFNGSNLLATGSEIQVECLDSNGNPLYIEYPQSNIQYTDVANFLISINVFNETYNGSGKLVFVGTTVKNEIVRWTANIAIDKTLQNSSKVRFYNKPSLEVRGLLYPTVNNNSALELTKVVPFTGSFYSYPATPAKDTNKLKVNPKTTDIDYRLTLTSPGADLSAVLFPTTSFNSQMEGQTINIIANNIQRPFSYTNTTVFNTTASFTVKKVLDSKTLQVSEPFYFQSGKDKYVTGINEGIFTSSYTWVAYNTGSDVYLTYTPPVGDPVLLKQSYAEVLYRNIKPFSGFVARHKLYRSSLVYPGGFQLIADEPLGALELLTDPITPNQTYTSTGRFYNQYHINKYWFTSSANIQPTHSVSPFMDGMKINKASSSYSSVDGTSYLIAKVDSPTTTGSATYYPFDSASYDSLQGDSYNSNFISLKAGSLYVISLNVELEKDKDTTDANVSFYFTSSIPSINFEKDYISPFGLFLGSVSTSDITKVKRFSDKQYLYFTPSNDYYGTLVIVPYHCVPTISELSFQVYGDYGFSPDILFTRIPFTVNVANETFQFKAELYDINSTLIYSNLTAIQTFDPTGISLYTTTADPAHTSFISGSLSISQSFYLPNIRGCPQVGVRLMGWHYPIASPPTATDGELCFTDVSSLGIANEDYVSVETTDGSTNTYAQSLSVRFTGSHAPGGGGGRRIYVDASGTKHLES